MKCDWNHPLPYGDSLWVEKSDAELLVNAARALLDHIAEFGNPIGGDCQQLENAIQILTRDQSPPTELNWKGAKLHLDNVIQEYTSIIGMPQTDVILVLSVVLKPLAERYHSGERTKELYDEMMAVG